MITNTVKKVYVNILFNLFYFGKQRHWLSKKFLHILPFFSITKKIHFLKGDLGYNQLYIGSYSKDQSKTFIDNIDMLENLNKNNYKTFEKDFIEIAQMTYFIFCYLFKADNPEEYYNDRWNVFLKKISHDTVMSFGKSGQTCVDLLTSLNNNVIPYEFSNSLENSQRVPPIHSKFGMVFDENGDEFKLLHCTVRKPNIKSHISLVLIEKDEKKYYKLSTTHGSENAEILRNINGFDYFVFDFNEFKEFSNTSSFMSEFSLLLVKAIHTNYNADVLPKQPDKLIFDMLFY
jgi:hypothetical protein